MSKTEFCAGVLQRLLVICAAMIAPGILVANAAGLPPLPAGLSAPAAPTHTPAFNLQTAAGGTLRTDDLRGKVVIARFWATW